MKRKMMFLICLILFIVSVSAVSAAEDINQTIGDADDSVGSVDTLSISLSDDVVGSADNGTFTDLQKKIDDADEGSTIYLDNDYAYDSGFSTEGITIAKTITINGNGYTIDALGQSKIFNINSQSVTLNNITFKNGYSNGNGGAVSWSGNDGVLVNSTFVSNSAQGYGGAVSWSGVDNVLVNSTFVSNSAMYGGAVYWTGGFGKLVDSSFVNNSADYTGGAVNWKGGSGKLVNSTFVNNSVGSGAVGSGGAVHWNGDDGVLVDSSFVNNSADNTGGAVCWSGFDGVLVNSTFVSNSAGSGGAVYWTGGSGKLVNSSFVSNSATSEGGALKLYYRSNTISESNKFYNNYAPNGTSIFLSDAYSSINNMFYLNSRDEIASCVEDANLSTLFDLNTFFVNGKAVSKDDYFNNKTDVLLVAEDVVVVYGDASGRLVAELKDTDGNPIGGAEIKFTIGSLAKSVNTSPDGQAGIPIGTLSPGKYTATISYDGSENYSASTVTALVTVTKAGTVISAPDVNIAYKNTNGELVATIVNEHGKTLVVNLNVNLNGKDYAVRTDSKGQASIPIDTLKPGTYTATISYKGSSNYKASVATAKVTVTKAATVISASDVNVAYKDPSGELVATIVNEHGKPLVVNLNVELNGKTYTAKTDSNGQMSLAIDTLKPGTYTATISYKGSSNYKASSATAKVTVTKAGTSISAPNVNVAYKDSTGELVATIVNEHGKPLVVNLNVDLNGKTYTVKTDSNGQASISIGTLSPGKYTATISYKGSSNYKASSASAKVTVTKATTSITAADINIAYKDPNGELVATVVNEHGKPLVVTLSININGKTYNVKTDSSGQASIPIDTLTPGTYTATISYKGSGNYKASSTTAKVTVTKAATIISAPDVSVAYGDSNGKLVSTITSEHGKPLVVNLNVELNGKTYAARTDSNGQISVSTADLAPGTYTATIKYKGSSNYEASSTTANIQVKK